MLLALFTVLGTDYLKELSHYNTLQKKTIEDEEYRREFFCDAMRKHEGLLSEACRKMLSNVENEVTYFPIPESTVDKSLKVSYVDSWMGERKYKGTSGHEGTDIMALKNERGVYPVLSMTDGTITNPVSYTHLDVYKRQGPVRAKRDYRSCERRGQRVSEANAAGREACAAFL